jgi:hypothetical protein
MKTQFSTLSDDLKAVIVQAFRTHGARFWRASFRNAWDGGRDEGAVRRLRNTVGPSGLNSIKTADIKAYVEAPLVTPAPAPASDSLEALILAGRFLAANYTDADMPDILPKVRAALAAAGVTL